MKKLLFIIMLISDILFSYNYDDILLKAQAKIYPKILLLDKNLNKKVINNQILFTIVYHDSDHEKALNIKTYILKNTGNKLENYDFKVQIKKFSQIKKYDNSTGYYILQGTQDQIKNICDIAKKHHVPTFSYEFNHVFQDVLISLIIKNSSVIYFNKEQNKEYNIDFINSFYQIVRFVHVD